MCGIFGILDKGGIERSLVKRSNDLLRHRGPDDEGYIYCNSNEVEPVGGDDTPKVVFEAGLSYTPSSSEPHRVKFPRMVLGHRRLSIIDLTPGGHQPLSYLDRYWIAFNGEIYNFVEIRSQLQEAGYRFSSESDTEVILAAYDRWGPACLERFNGMWSIALYDQRLRTLFLARDRFGVKPLYYAVDGGRFVFASEIKALLPMMKNAPRANLPRLLDYLVWSISDFSEETMFEQVVQLPPGHYMTLDLAQVLEGAAGLTSGDIAPKRWYEPTAKTTLLDEKSGWGLRDALADSITIRLRSDVNVGSCLSGGLDSSSIVCLSRSLLSHAAPETIRSNQFAFSARSELKEFDESRYAQAVGQATGVKIEFITPTAGELFEHLDELIWHQDEPFNTTSVFAQWLVFKMARASGVIVMLDGQGADESLCGYRGFFGAFLASLISRRKFIAWFQEAAAIRQEVGFGWVRVIGYTLAYFKPSWGRLIGAMDKRTKGRTDWLAPNLQSSCTRSPAMRLGDHRRSVQEMCFEQLCSINLPMLLRWADRNSMAASVEARMPFLDYRFVELALGLPDDAKVGGGVLKRSLRAAMRGLVPEVVLNRKDKMGFETSEAKWLLKDAISETDRLLTDALASLEHIVCGEKIRRELEEMRAGTRAYDNKIWRIIVAGSWTRRFGIAL